MNYRPFTARGFPGEFDRTIAEVGVAEPDRTHSVGLVRLCAETEREIYEGSFSPRRIRYRQGARPVLERIAETLREQDQLASALGAMQWVFAHVDHASLRVQATPPNRGMTEEQLIDSGVGWCNEQARIFIALCEVMEMPARLCFLFHGSKPCGHATAEALIDGRWVFFDPTFNICIRLPDGRGAEARQMAAGGAHQALAHRAYRAAYDQIFPRMKPPYRDRHALEYDANRDTPGELMAHQGFSNYLIDGVQALDDSWHRPTPC